jgi:hypothetical protein
MRVDGLRSEHTVPYAVAHDLRLSEAELGLIAERHGGGIEQHAGDLPLLLPSGRRTTVRSEAAETVRALGANRSWVTLFGVQDDPLITGIAAQLQAQVGPRVRLVLSLICSSPHGVTPAHMDERDVLLLQLQGSKEFGTGSFSKRSDAEAALRRSFGPGRENLRELPDQQQSWSLHPGVGLVVPAYTPHWATVGDEVSVALSVAMSTPELLQRERVHRMDAELLRRHVRLPAPGRSRLADRARLALFAVGRRLR